MSSYALVLVSPTAWEAAKRKNPFTSLKALAADLEACQRRLSKDVDADLLRQRFVLTARAIQRRAEEVAQMIATPVEAFHVLNDGGAARSPALEGFEGLLDLLLDSGLGLDRPERALITSPVVDELDLAALQKLLTQLDPSGGSDLSAWWSVAVQTHCPAVVWVVDDAAGRPADAGAWPSPTVLTESLVVDPVDISTVAIPDVFAGDDLREGTFQHFWQLVREHAALGECTPVGRVADAVLTEALRCIATYPATGAFLLRYGDGTVGDAAVWGSRVATGPAGALPEVEPSILLKSGLMSMRHPELDSQTDMSWFGNAELSTGESQAVVAERATALTIRRLMELVSIYPGVAIDIDLHQTGFVPAIVGFYRALAMIDLPAPVRVTPIYFQGPTVVRGTPWVTRQPVSGAS